MKKGPIPRIILPAQAFGFWDVSLPQEMLNTPPNYAISGNGALIGTVKQARGVYISTETTTSLVH